MTCFFADVVHVVEHDEPVRRWPTRTVLKAFSDGVGVRHVGHQAAAPCVHVHVGAGGQGKGLDDAVRVVRLVNAKPMQEARRQAERTVPGLTGVPAHREVRVGLHVLLEPMSDEG